MLKSIKRNWDLSSLGTIDQNDIAIFSVLISKGLINKYAFTELYAGHYEFNYNIPPFTTLTREWFDESWYDRIREIVVIKILRDIGSMLAILYTILKIYKILHGKGL